MSQQIKVTVPKNPRKIKRTPWWDYLVADGLDFGEVYLSDGVWLSDVADPDRANEELVEVGCVRGCVSEKDVTPSLKSFVGQGVKVSLFVSPVCPWVATVEVSVWSGRKRLYRNEIELDVEAEDDQTMTVHADSFSVYQPYLPREWKDLVSHFGYRISEPHAE